MTHYVGICFKKATAEPDLQVQTTSIIEGISNFPLGARVDVGRRLQASEVPTPNQSSSSQTSGSHRSHHRQNFVICWFSGHRFGHLWFEDFDRLFQVEKVSICPLAWSQAEPEVERLYSEIAGLGQGKLIEQKQQESLRVGHCW